MSTILPPSSSAGLISGLTRDFVRYKHLRASYKILLSNVLPISPLSFTDPTFEAYCRPPYPQLNPYVNYPEDVNNRAKPAVPIAFRKLMPHLLGARRKAVLSLVEYLKDVGEMDPGIDGPKKALREVLARGKELAKELGVE